MSSTTATHTRTLTALRRRVGYPHLLATTLVLVVATILLGVATRAAGAGLACDANWPLCDGGVLNLFPAGFPSFFEWIHRVVAMVAGVFIVGAAVQAWRGSAGKLVTWAVTIGLVLTPIQVSLGRETVLSYDLTVLNLHFWTAIAIFVCFAAATVLVWEHRIEATRVPLALGVATLLVPVQIVFSPLVIESYTPVMHTLQDSVTLALLFASLVAGIVGAIRFDGYRSRALTVTPLLGLVVIYLGREAVMGFDPLVDFIYLVATGAVCLVLGVLTWDTYRTVSE